MKISLVEDNKTPAAGGKATPLLCAPILLAVQ